MSLTIGWLFKDCLSKPRQRFDHTSQRKPTLVLGNSKGQMAIFVALIFQVLFVFFAMAINVALVVHDKINLQNAADLAAYYGAQKQAELLNVMAHTNYQIRQSWKLLAWRYRVLGAMGLRNPPHPAFANGPLVEQPMFSQNRPPSICVTYRPNWGEVSRENNLCRVPSVRIPPLPRVPVIAGFDGINARIHALATRLREQVSQHCDKHGAYNFWFAASILKAFREDQKNRKDVMYALAKNLSKADFRDLDGHSVVAGVEATLGKNLTHSNSEGFPQVQFFNSLKGKERQQWLSEIRVSPTLLYIDNLPGDGCVAQSTALADPNRHPRRERAHRLLDSILDSSGHLRTFARDSTTFDVDDNYAYSLGVEKNPWIWAYVGGESRDNSEAIIFSYRAPCANGGSGVCKTFWGKNRSLVSSKMAARGSKVRWK